jgi:predicted transcriptional regulator
MESVHQDEIVQLTADIVSAYVANNKIGTNELSKLIEEVHLALVRAPAAATEPEQKPLVPAVPIRKSVTPDYIVSLEDGRKFKSLKRHLQGSYGMTPDEYRAKWGLPRDYPMVAPNYAKARSDLAKRMGLGRKAGATPAKKAGGGRGRKRAAK